MDIMTLLVGKNQTRPNHTGPNQIWESSINSFTGIKYLIRLCEQHAQSQALKNINY